jgi:hypothetical protein
VLRRTAPALLLLVLAPLTAEFLLGDFTIRQLPFLLVLIPQYGGGALLIREVARRTGRGWPAMILLALAYAIIEEGLTTQSLFNPHYLGLRLLDYGYLPRLGISMTWTVFVLSIHVVWSIATPILIAEGLAGSRRTTPWLGKVGLTIVAVLFLLGCTMTATFTFKSNGFLATLPQLLAAAVAAVAAIVLAFVAEHCDSQRSTDYALPAPWLIGGVTLVLATIFEWIEHLAPRYGVPPEITTLGMVTCELAMLALLLSWSRSRRWRPAHYLAIAAGTVLTYAWVGLSRFLGGTTNLGMATTRIDKIGQVVVVLVILALIGVGLEAAASSPSVDSQSSTF